MYVTVEAVKSMSEVVDCEVMNDVIFAVGVDGKYWYAKQDQPKYDDVHKVPFYPAKPWMVQRWEKITGKGVSHVNDQLRDEELNKLIKEQQFDMYQRGKEDRGFGFDAAMQGASSDEYADVAFPVFERSY